MNGCTAITTIGLTNICCTLAPHDPAEPHQATHHGQPIRWGGWAVIDPFNNWLGLTETGDLTRRNDHTPAGAG